MEVTLPVEGVQGLACLCEFGGEVPGDASFDRPDHQSGWVGGKVGGEPGLQRLAVMGLPELGRQPPQLLTQRPRPLPVVDLAGCLQRAPGPGG